MIFISIVFWFFNIYTVRSQLTQDEKQKTLLPSIQPTINSEFTSTKIYIQTLSKPVQPYHYPSYSPTKKTKQTKQPSSYVHPLIIDHPHAEPIVIYECSPITPDE